MYSIKALSRITGIPPNTLRSWERRYGIPGPARDEMGFRLYSAEDAAYLSLIGRLISSGHSIGKLAGMPQEELHKLDMQRAATGPEEGRDILRKRLIDAINAGDVERYRQHLVQALVVCPPVDLAAHILTPALQHIGILWEKGKISVAQEHAMTAITRQVMFSAVNMLQWAPFKARIAFATLPNEQHEIGCLMAYYIAAARGHHCTYFGANMPIDALIDAVPLTGARVLVLSIVYPPDEKQTAADLAEVASGLAPETKLWLGSRMEFSISRPNFLKFESFEPYDKHLIALG